VFAPTRTRYRGQDAFNKWHIGTLTITAKHYFITEYGITHEVKPETVEEINF